MVRSEHPALAIRSYPEPCTKAAITCSNTTRSGMRRRWQPSGWVGETAGRSGSSAENWTHRGSNRQTGRTGTVPPRRGWVTPLLSPEPVPARYFRSATRLLSVALSRVSIALARDTQALASEARERGLGKLSRHEHPSWAARDGEPGVPL